MLGLTLPGPVSSTTTSTTTGSGCAGIDELTHEIGATAVDLLSGLIQRGGKGLPDVPAEPSSSADGATVTPVRAGAVRAKRRTSRGAEVRA